MGSTSASSRCHLPIHYKKLYKKNLDEVMKSECGSRAFGTALCWLAVSPVVADCNILMSCFDGNGTVTNPKVLWATLCGRSNRDMEILKVSDNMMESLKEAQS